MQPHELHKIYEPYDEPEEAPRALGEPPQVVPITQRVDALAKRSRVEATDLILDTLHQFLLARTPADVICRSMRINVNSYSYLRGKLKERQRESAKSKDPFDYLGAMIAEVEEAAGVAWREVANAPPKEWARRMRAIEIVMKANIEKGRILQLAGMFDNSPMRQALKDDDADNGGATALQKMSASFLSGGYASNRKSLEPGDVIIDDD